ncbi:PRC-barrel domain-containing protein [Sphingobium sufflavum]|uniref:PRC-barrel domain-containing protein n=1 Tax=Sphingobium sufflavum TaxID=1129547 RepID=UPI001F38F605|nr:PRC-barrel domain-containing protein [Sphingobium sufflavum]MCE7794976.1 PRC-barrel domain-containing protein [Sphingobium sufflavum]
MADTGTYDRSSVIASDRVEGTAVYNPEGERLGSISRLLIGKRDGQVECAVLSFGGFLGIGHEHYPLPWRMLSYDLDKGGYVVALDKKQLEDAPRYELSREPQFDEAYTKALYQYYGVAPLF